MDSRQPDETGAANGSTSGLLRQTAQDRTTRRNMLRRGGIVAAASVAGLTLLDQRRAEAANGNNFVLGTTNDADNTTELHPTTAGQLESPLFHINGGALSGTSTSMVVDGPNAGQSTALVVNNGGGGLALSVNSASTSTTVGLAISANGSGSAGGVSGSSGSGTGVSGNSASGNGVSGNGKRGGVFKGKAANIQLTPSAGSHPRVGSKGDLFVDHNAHLWFCRGGTTWVRLA